MFVTTNNIVLWIEISGPHVPVLLHVTPCSLNICTDFLVDHTVFFLMVEV